MYGGYQRGKPIIQKAKDGTSASKAKANKTIDYESDLMLRFQDMIYESHFPRLTSIAQPSYAFNRMYNTPVPILDKFIQRKKVELSTRDQSMHVGFSCCEFTSDGRFAFAGGDQGNLVYHNTYDFSFYYQETIHQYNSENQGSHCEIRRLRFLPSNNNDFLSCSGNGFVVLLDNFLNKKATLEVFQRTAILDLTVFSDAKRFAACSEKGIHVCALKQASIGAPVCIDSRPITAVCYHPFARLLASGRDGFLTIYAEAPSEPAAPGPAGEKKEEAIRYTVVNEVKLPDASTRVVFVMWHHSGAFVGAGMSDNMIRFYDIRDMRAPTHQYHLDRKPTCFRWNPIYREVFAVGDESANVTFFDFNLGMLGPTVTDVVGFASDSRVLASAAHGPQGFGGVFDLTPAVSADVLAMHEVLRSALPSAFHCLAKSAGRTLTFTPIGSILKAHRTIDKNDCRLIDLAFHPIGHVLCTIGSDKDLRFWGYNRCGNMMIDVFHKSDDKAINPTDEIYSHNKSHKEYAINQGKPAKEYPTISTALQRYISDEMESFEVRGDSGDKVLHTEAPVFEGYF